VAAKIEEIGYFLSKHKKDKDGRGRTHMRREQESWKKEECIQGEEEQIAKETNKIPTGHSIVVVVFSLCTSHTPLNLAIHCIVGLCFSVERREGAVCCLPTVLLDCASVLREEKEVYCLGKAETKQAILL
jgi:hypothetical protein